MIKHINPYNKYNIVQYSIFLRIYLRDSKTFALPSFGVALAACRSATAANRRLTAKRFLEVARRSSNEADGRRHIDKVWRDAAQLDSVIKFLTQRP